MKIRFDWKYHLSEGFSAIFTHGFMSFAAVCMIVACLLIMGTFSLVAINLDNMLGELEKENEFLAYVDESFSQEQARGLEQELSGLDNVAEVTFVTREQALEDFLQGREENKLLSSLPASVLRDRYRIHVKDIEDMSETVKLVEGVQGIAKISVMLKVAQGFVLMRNIAAGVALILIGILMIISLFIISNTIKLATFHRREEIAIMKMCGATNGFVRWPFVFEGLILGMTGAVLAFFLQWGIYQLVCSAVIEANGLSLVVIIPYADMAKRILAIFAASGFVIGVGGSLMAIRKFLQV